MKNKGGKNINFLLILFLAAGFFIFPKISSAFYKGLIISEIMYNPKGNNEEHSKWVEIINNSPETVYLSTTGNETSLGWKIKDLKIVDTSNHYLYSPQKETMEIKKGEFAIIASDSSKFKADYAEISGTLILKSAITLPSSKGENSLRLMDNDLELNSVIYSKFSGGDDNGKTLERIDNILDDWQESYELGGTPGRENSKKPAPKVYPSGIYINEILPNPEGSDEENEYIELYNSTMDSIDLYGWILKDKSATGKYVFPKNSNIKASNFLVVYRKDFSFAINNSDELIYLSDPNEKSVSEVSFSGSAKENISYAYDTESSAWRWTSKKTPGAKNEFDKILSGKIKKDNPVYAGMYANFKVEADSDAQKFTWDFGDGHKSYLKKTKHKYEKIGEYKGSLKISGNGETSQYFFTVKVEKYSAPKVKIVGVKANPKGKDTSLETITVKNSSKKKVNLKEWSVATGWKELYNHPINKKFILKPGETRELTRKYSAFTLNNKQTKIELRQPDGVVASKVKYNKKEGIQNDEAYEKTESGWKWTDTQTNTDETETNADEISVNTEETAVNTSETEADTENTQNNIEENTAYKEVQTAVPEEISEVLGAEVVKNSENLEVLNIKSDNGNFGKQKFLSTLIWGLNQKISSVIGLITSFF